MASILNQSTQNFRAIGVVNELSLTREDCEIKVRDNSGNESKANGERIKGKVAIRFGNGVKTFDVFVNSLSAKGEKAKQWDNAVAMLGLNPEIGGDNSKDYSVVSVSGRVDENIYRGQDGNAKIALRWSASRISTRVSENDEQGCTLSGNFFIKSIHPETKDDEETGRLLVDLVGINYNAMPFIVNTIVEEELADTFVDIYEVGQTANFDIDVVMEHIGAKPTGKKMFGSGGSVSVNSGYDKEILVIVGGDEPIEMVEDEDGNPIDNGWIDPNALKKGLKERENKIAEIKNGDNKKSTAKTTTSLKDKKRVGKKPKIEELDDDDDFDDPFEDDDF